MRSLRLSNRAHCPTKICHSKEENMDKIFFVEMKNKQGEYEPLGVMTMAKAIEHSWECDHAALQFTRVCDLSPAGTR